MLIFHHYTWETQSERGQSVLGGPVSYFPARTEHGRFVFLLQGWLTWQAAPAEQGTRCSLRLSSARASQTGIVLSRALGATRGVTCLAQSKSQRSGSQPEFRKLAWETVEQGASLVKDLLIFAAALKAFVQVSWEQRGTAGRQVQQCLGNAGTANLPFLCHGLRSCSDLLTLHYPVVTWVHSHLSDFRRDCTSDSSFQATYCTWKPL